MPIRCGRACLEPAARKAWGCDAPTAEPAFYIPCLRCSAKGCEDCGDKGAIGFHRCPSSILSDDQYEVVKAYLLYRGKSIYPVAGGWSEQSRVFLDAVGLLDRAWNVLAEVSESDDE